MIVKRFFSALRLWLRAGLRREVQNLFTRFRGFAPRGPGFNPIDPKSGLLGTPQLKPGHTSGGAPHPQSYAS